MRKLTLTLITSILFASTTFGQTVNFSDLLEKSKCKSFECFNDFITTKGFSLSESNEKFYLFMSDKKFPTTSTPSVTTKNTAIILFGTDGSTKTGTRTAVKSHYDDLLKQIKAIGFISTKTENIENGVIVHYKLKSNPKISVAIQTDQLEKEGVKWTSYDISMTRYK
jgi:hypothetical protein